MDLVSSIIAWEEGYATPRQTLELFSHLVKTGQAWNLQGTYGRYAVSLIDEGYLDEAGNITSSAYDVLADLEAEDDRDWDGYNEDVRLGL